MFSLYIIIYVRLLYTPGYKILDLHEIACEHMVKTHTYSYYTVTLLSTNCIRNIIQLMGTHTYTSMGIHKCNTESVKRPLLDMSRLIGPVHNSCVIAKKFASEVYTIITLHMYQCLL